MPATLIHFKLLARCFGVISFLKRKQFTRDVDACISFAGEEEKTTANLLTDMRHALEQGTHRTFEIKTIKADLFKLFDTYFTGV